MVAQAIDAYNAGKYADALAHYESALRVPFGNQRSGVFRPVSEQLAPGAQGIGHRRLSAR
ncbi:MAG: hypothetical protein IPJ99_00355 [Betaproteobacteria bacterium]|nr:hypothetical protein [Betaproteobacteria bacterium]